MKSLKWNSWNFYFNEKKSDSIKIFQIMNPGGWQKVFQYKGKTVISNPTRPSSSIHPGTLLWMYFNLHFVKYCYFLLKRGKRVELIISLLRLYTTRAVVPSSSLLDLNFSNPHSPETRLTIPSEILCHWSNHYFF